MLPNLPTDNLYKFLALAGIVLIIFAFSYPVSQIRDDKLQIAVAEKEHKIAKVRADRKVQRANDLRGNYKSESESLDSESKLLNLEYKEINEIVSAVDIQKTIPNKSAANIEALNHALEHQKSLFAELDIHRSKIAASNSNLKLIKEAMEEANDEVSLLNIQLEWHTHLLEEATNHLELFMLFVLLFGSGGFVLCNFGFTLWYNKIQRYQDAVLEKQAKDTGIELSKMIELKPFFWFLKRRTKK